VDHVLAGGGLRSGGRRIVLLFKVRHAAVMARPHDSGKDFGFGQAIGSGGLDGGHGGFAVKTAIRQGEGRFPQLIRDAGQGGDELLLVVGGVGHGLADDEPAVNFDGGLGVVTLLEATPGFHDTAFGISVVILVFGGGGFIHGSGSGRGFATGLFPTGFTGGPLGEGGGASGFFKGGGFAATRFDDFAGGFELGDAVLTPDDFTLDGEAILQGGAVGGFGFDEELGDFGFKQGHDFAGFTITVGGVLAGVGHDLGAINGDGAQFEEFEFAGEEEGFEEGFLDEGVVFAAEGADGIVVGMGVGADESDGEVLAGGVFDAAGAEQAGGVAINEEGEHHGGRELGIPGAAVVDAVVVEVQGRHGINHKVGDVVVRNPLLNAGGEEHGGLAINVLESGSHGGAWHRARRSTRKSLL